MRVLLVEDDDDCAKSTGLILGRFGANVIAAGSAAEALHSFQQTTPDIIISDIGMVEGDGYALLRELRALPVQRSLLRRSTDSLLPGDSSSGTTSSSDSSLVTHNSSMSLLTPAIALTGYATTKDRERALSAGYQLHLAEARRTGRPRRCDPEPGFPGRLSERRGNRGTGKEGKGKGKGTGAVGRSRRQEQDNRRVSGQWSVRGHTIRREIFHFSFVI